MYEGISESVCVCMVINEPEHVLYVTKFKCDYCMYECVCVCVSINVRVTVHECVCLFAPLYMCAHMRLRAHNHHMRYSCASDTASGPASL